ncbi:MAG: hypothetical protein GX102_12095 [Porphyromonadaceae bacterium]|nr:hypothetical protein [Porphyromonadaceae bacterium]
MKRIKNYFRTWDSARYLRLILGTIFGLAYAFDGQTFYLLFSIFFLVQAIMNIGCGCAGNSSCAVEPKKKVEIEER